MSFIRFRHHLGVAVLLVSASLAVAAPQAQTLQDPARKVEAPKTLTIVAAENFYGSLARAVAGEHADIVSILSNPDADPHLFEADAKTARSLSDARIVIANGADYDPWMTKLLAASANPDRSEIVAAELVGRKAGDNPHLWYDPETMAKVARSLSDDLVRVDPAHADAYRGNADAYLKSLSGLTDKMAAMKARYAGQPVTATEPVFGYMAEALGLEMRNQPFQMAVMNGTEPSPREIADFETDLRTHRVRALLYNSQADDEAVKRLVDIARASQVPVVGVSETEPAGMGYVAWMTGQLTALDKALSEARS